MGIQERRAREKEELRTHIISAGRELFAEEGFEAVSVRKIAEKIEYSPTTIYLYFQDKADLFDCVVEERMREFYDKLQTLEQTGSSPLDTLRRGLRAYVDFWIAHPNEFRMTFTTDLKSLDAERKWRCLELGQKIYSKLRDNLRECHERGQLEIRNLELTAQMVWVQIFGVMSLQIMKPYFPWADGLIDNVIDSVIDTLRAPVPA